MPSPSLLIQRFVCHLLWVVLSLLRGTDRQQLSTGYWYINEHWQAALVRVHAWREDPLLSAGATCLRGHRREASPSCPIPLSCASWEMVVPSPHCLQPHPWVSRCFGLAIKGWRRLNRNHESDLGGFHVLNLAGSLVNWWARWGISRGQMSCKDSPNVTREKGEDKGLITAFISGNIFPNSFSQFFTWSFHWFWILFFFLEHVFRGHRFYLANDQTLLMTAEIKILVMTVMVHSHRTLGHSGSLKWEALC